MIRKTIRIGMAPLAAAAALLATPAAQADDGITTKLSGFGTLGMTKNNGAGTYRSSEHQFRGATGSSVDFGVDSRLGVQGDVRFNEVFSATAQVLSIRRHNDFEPTVEWLFGEAKVHSKVSLRAGRLGLPAFMVSDFRNVGYATPWIRTPVEAYSAMPFSTFDGAQAVFRHSIGDYNLTVQPSFGKSKAHLTVQTPGLPLPLDLRMKSNDVRSLNARVERGDWTFRWGKVLATSDVALRGRHPVAGWIDLPSSTFKDNFTGYGLQYDNGSLLVMGELITRRSPSIDTDAHYVTAAYRVGAWTPYVTVGGYKDKTNKQESDSQSLGLRWDAMKNLSVKAQYDLAEPEPGGFAPPLPTDKAKVVSLAVDFVF